MKAFSEVPKKIIISVKACRKAKVRLLYFSKMYRMTDVAVICIALNYCGKHKRTMLLRDNKPKGNQPATRGN